MSNQFVQQANVIDFVATEDLDAGAVVVIGSIVGQTHAPVANGALGSLTIEGGVKVKKEAGLQIDQGDIVFWDDALKEADKTNTNDLMGQCLLDAAAGDAEVLVKLVPLGRIA